MIENFEDQQEAKKRMDKSIRALKFIIALIVISIILIASLLTNMVYSQTKQQVYTELLSQGVKHPKIVLRQAIKETGWMQCSECSLDHNNLFGFQWKGKYLEFDTWEESVVYYKKWQDKWFDGRRSYYDFLGCMWLHRNGDCVPYATSKTYIEELKLINV